MAGFIRYISYTLFACIVLLSYPKSSCFAADQPHNHKLLFIFGDSLFDPGNNIYLNLSQHIPSYYYPYGMSLHNHSTGRFSDGLVVPDFIALAAKLHIIPPFLKPNSSFVDGASFASAGAGVLNIHADAMNLKMQVTNLKSVLMSMKENIGQCSANHLTKGSVYPLSIGGDDYFTSVTNFTTANHLTKGSVYLFSIGGDDYFTFTTDYPNATEAEMNQFVSYVIGNLTDGLKVLYAAGGRKFAFQNVAPIGCLPMMKQTYNLTPDQCAQLPLEMARRHNLALSNALKQLETSLEGFKYSIFDYFTEIGNMINNPSKYGFKVGTVACCGSGAYRASDCGTQPYELCENPNEYVFFDGGHTTQHANSRLSQLIWNGTLNVTWPYNVQQLFQLP